MRILYSWLAILLLMTNTALYAQALRTSWISTIQGNRFEENNSLAKAPCGDVYAVGFFQDRFGPLSSFGINDEDGFIAKYNDQGGLQWVQQLRGSSTDRINGIAITDDHSIYITGEFRNTLYYNNDSLVSQGRLDVFVAKLDSSGQFQWAFSAGDIGDDSAHDLDILHNGNLVVTGYFEVALPWGTDTLASTTSRDVFVAGVAPTGVPLWTSALKGPGVDECHSVATDTSNCFYIMGSFRDVLYVNGGFKNSFGGVDAFLVKYDSVGQLLWAQTMGGPAGDQGRYVAVDAAQNVVAGGWVNNSFAIEGTLTYLTGEREEDAFAVKYASDGRLIWAKIIGRDNRGIGSPDGGFFDERIYGVATDEHSNLYFMGTLDSLLVLNGDSLRNRHLNRPTDIFILKYDSTGSYKWGQTLGHYYNDFCYDLLVPNSRELYIAGSFQDTSIFVGDTLISDFGYDIFLAKFSMDTSLGLRALPPSAPPLSARLSPNPSATHSLLTVALERPSALRIVVCDALGKVVYEQTTALLPQGQQQFPLARRGWPAGIYFVAVQSAEKATVLSWVLE